jgi:hypothetical protein
VIRAGRYTALAFRGDEVVRQAVGELADGVDVVFLAESLQDPEHDLVARRGTVRLLGALFWP